MPLPSFRRHAFALTVAAAAGCTPPPTATAPSSAAPNTEPELPTAPSTCGGSLLCEDFEGHTAEQAPGAPWSDATGDSGAVVSISSERAHSGSQSVHIHAGTGKSYRRGYFAIHGDPVFPAASKEMYGRAMVWLDAAPITPEGKPPVHWTLLQGEGRSADDRFNHIYRFGGQHQEGTGWMANFETTPPTRTDCWQHSSSTIPVQQWACVEWHFAVASNEMEMWVDGQALEDVHIRNATAGEGSGCLGQDLEDKWLAPPAFDSLYLGWERYQEPTNDRDVWIDDVEIALTRVGCPGGVE